MIVAQMKALYLQYGFSLWDLQDVGLIDKYHKYMSKSTIILEFKIFCAVLENNP